MYIHYTRSYVWYLTAPLGLLFALIGLNIQHDANHGAVSKNPFVNRLLGLSQNWIGGSSVDWIHQHVVQHHVFCNDLHHDPDLAGSAALRINPLKPLMQYHAFQYIYIFVMLLFFGFSVVFSSLSHLISGIHFIPMSKMLQSYRLTDLLATSPFVLRWLVLPLVLKPSAETLLQTVPMYVTAGFYLAFFFIISHNFVGIHVFDRENPKVDKSFLYTQVASSANVGGAWLCFLNGGLNYQIEHHLFPRVSHVHYPLIAPHVRKFCLLKNIPYVHFRTVSQNMWSCIDYLYIMGTEKNSVVHGREM